MLKLREGIVELYKKVAISVPPDVEAALSSAAGLAAKDTEAERMLTRIVDQIRSSRQMSRPACEDPGIPLFHVKIPSGISHADMRATIIEATKVATKKIPLKAVAVDISTGENSGDNTGEGFPIIYFDESPSGTLTIDLMLTGSMAEKEGRTYKLPSKELDAGMDLSGVGKCVIDAVRSAGGRGCPPYIVGVGVGASREQATRLSKAQILRKISDTNPNARLAQLEQDLHGEINGLDIGPLGLGGPVTAIGVKIGTNHCHTDSCIVDVTLSCWADRRGRLVW